MIKRYLAILLLGVSSVFAQTVQTTPNLITSGTTHTWTGVTTGNLPANYMPGGPTPIYDPNTNTVTFSYNSNAYVGQTIAINNALAGVGAGVKINGYSYGYDVRNMNGDNRQPGTDTFTVATALRGVNNSVLLSHNQYFNTKFEWTTYTGTKTASTPINMADATYLQIGVTGGDNGFWGGYFGPQIRNVSMKLNYTVDPCATNPAYSTTCAGYSSVTTQTIFAGMSGAQTYALNNALSGSGVMVHGFDYGYRYSVGSRYCTWMDFLGGCIGTWVYPTAAVTTNITDNNGTAIYNEVNTHASGTTGNFDKQLRFTASRPISSMGSFTMTPTGNITQMYSSVVYTPDPCVVDPLSATTCPGYQAAYTAQQCSISALYATSCPGYTQAYFNQQCTINALHDTACPGYAAAYLTQQCTINPLYSTTCSGYETAYFNQQCSLDPLYNSRCPGYTQAYHDQQCSINPLYASDCNGYAQAYHDQQCSANTLYAADCPGYAAAYKTQQCTANALYATDCPGYDQAYLNSRCIQDSLYSTQCEGYKTAYAIKYLTKLDPAVTTAVNQQLTETVEVAKAAAVVSDPVSAATTNTPSTTSASSVSPTATISAVKPAPAATTVAGPVAQTETKKDEKKSEDKPQGGPQGGEQKADGPKPKTAREELAAKREEAAKKEAVAKGKDLANQMGQAADLEAQKAIQNVVIQAMGFTPGFDQYGKGVVPDSQFYRPFTVYGGQKNIDSRAGLRMFGGSDRTHEEMIDSQYQLGK